MERDKQYLLAIMREVSSLPAILKGYDEDRFLKSEKTQKAACMTLLNIGELVKNISPELKTKYPAIPWREIAGFRDITAHKYASLNMRLVWKTAKEKIPELSKSVKEILEQD